MSLKIGNNSGIEQLTNLYADRESTPPAEQTAQTNETAQPQTAAVRQNLIVPPKLPPIDGKVEFTAVGCDTEYELAHAAYRAAAAEAGIADKQKQNEFANKMIGGRAPQLTLNGKEIDDRKVADDMRGKPYTFELSKTAIQALRQFRQEYINNGGQIHAVKNPRMGKPDGAANGNQTSQTGAVQNASTFDEPKYKHFKVFIPADGKPANADRVLLYHIEKNLGAPNLWGPDYEAIRDTAREMDVRPQNLKLSQMGNKIVAEYELSPNDLAKLEKIKAGVQEYNNQVEAIADKFRDNDELASFIRGVGKGALKSLKNNWQMVSDPAGTLNNLWKAVSDIPATYAALKKELGETWEEFKQADPSKKSEMLGELVGQVAVDALLAKGAGKAVGILAKTPTGAAIISRAENLAGKAGAALAAQFSDEAAAAARASVSRKLAQTTLYSGAAGAEVLPEFVTIAGNKFGKAAVKFSEFVDEIAAKTGNGVRKYADELKDAYRQYMKQAGFGDEVIELNLQNTRGIISEGYKGAWPPEPPSGIKPKMTEPGGMEYRYQRYVYDKYSKGAQQKDILSPADRKAQYFDTAAAGGRPGRPGGADQVKTRQTLTDNEGFINTENTKLGQRTVNGKQIDNMVDMHRPNELGGTDFVEVDEILGNGTPKALLRGKLKTEIPALGPNDRLIYIDEKNPNLRIEYSAKDNPAVVDTRTAKTVNQ